MAIVVDLVSVLLIEGSLSGIPPLTPFALAFLYFLYYRGLPVFEYDSDGEVLILIAQEPVLQGYSQKFFKRIEFPKRKLKGYKVKKRLFQRILILYIHSHEGHSKTSKMKISYLKSKEVKDVEMSLKRCLKRNSEKQS
jgi:hypothetical protein